MAWTFAMPALLGLLAFVLLPFVLAVLLSLTDLRLGSPLATEFVGLTQYQRIFNDSAFLHALKNNILFARSRAFYTHLLGDVDQFGCRFLFQFGQIHSRLCG